MKNRYFYFLPIFIILFTGCYTSDKTISAIDDRLLSPNYAPIIYNSYPSEYLKDETIGRELLGSFPFISLSHNVDFKGKFNDTFYDKIPYRYKAAFLPDVNFYKLLSNPFLYDFIYIQPIWIENFKRVSNDLFENICYSYNLSAKEREILKWWIKQGGVLWMESGIFATGYENYTTEIKRSDKKILKKLHKKSKNLSFLGHSIRTSHFRAKKIDLVKIDTHEVLFKHLVNHKGFKKLNTLSLQVDKFAQNYFVLDGENLIQDKRGTVLASQMKYGKGKVISLLPLDFTTRYYDGELFRWNLLYYGLDKG